MSNLNIIYTFNMIILYWMYPSLAISPSSTQLLNSTSVDDIVEPGDDPLADDVDWLSAVGGCVIVLGIAAGYAIYVICRQRKELKEQPRSPLMLSVHGNPMTQGHLIQLDDFK
eukprot:186392_1